MIRWEYDIRFLGFRGGEQAPGPVVVELNRMGGEGWEVCGILEGYIILKRQLASDVKPEDDDFLGGRRGGGPG